MVTWWLSGDIIELLIYHQPGVKPSLTFCPFGVLGYVAGHSLTTAVQSKIITPLPTTFVSERSHCHHDLNNNKINWQLMSLKQAIVVVIKPKKK